MTLGMSQAVEYWCNIDRLEEDIFFIAYLHAREEMEKDSDEIWSYIASLSMCVWLIKM